MAIGDQADITGRLNRGMPKGWFGTLADMLVLPLIAAIIQGIAACLSFLYSLYAYAALQTRIKTATDGYLDLISYDYFGLTLPRDPGESDSAYRARIIANLYAIKATRPAMEQVLTTLTGNAPIIVEPRRAADTGAYRVSTSGYGVAGHYGSMLMPYQAFITAFRSDSGPALAYIAGYGIVTGGYSQASRACYIDLSDFEQGVTDASIYSVIAATKPEGTISWVQIADLGGEADYLGAVIGGFIVGDYITIVD